jgi:PIN domain nuclease of toxin-antitoxin system
MNLLLDTHVLIWWMEKNPRLGVRASKLRRGSTARPVVSAASVWEMSIKAAIGRLDFVDPLETWVPRLQDDWGVHPLPITFEHAMILSAFGKSGSAPSSANRRINGASAVPAAIK